MAYQTKKDAGSKSQKTHELQGFSDFFILFELSLGWQNYDCRENRLRPKKMQPLRQDTRPLDASFLNIVYGQSSLELNCSSISVPPPKITSILPSPYTLMHSII